MRTKTKVYQYAIYKNGNYSIRPEKRFVTLGGAKQFIKRISEKEKKGMEIVKEIA